MASGLSLKLKEELLQGVILLSYDNFTPQVRTPWGGDYIVSKFKKDLLGSTKSQLVGESWEFSYHDPLPSYLLNTDIKFKDLALTCPDHLFGEDFYEKEKIKAHEELLVKVIDSSEPLSVQIHPYDHYSGLTSGQCGKPESWLILRTMPGCGIYLGLKEKLSKDEFAKAFQKKDHLSSLFYFHEVQAGDYFDLPPCTLHAIGGGVTLLEPQRALPEKEGVTYRLWDWDRCYNSDGFLDPKGSPRDLHIDEVMDLMDFDGPAGEELVKEIKKYPTREVINSSCTAQNYPGNPYYKIQIVDIQEEGVAQMLLSEGYAVGVSLKGSGRINTPKSERLIRQGQSFFCPNSCQDFKLSCDLESWQVVFIMPAKGNIQWS